MTKYRIGVVDLFCGIGGLSHGMQKAGLKVHAGYDFDASCAYAYEANNRGKFHHADIADTSAKEIYSHYKSGEIKVLAGCAPCQPFSSFTNKRKDKDSRWGLLSEFGRLVLEVQPDIVSMENVPQLRTKDVFKKFCKLLKDNGYKLHVKVAYCPAYGIPQRRKRLLLLASRLGEIKIIDEMPQRGRGVTVADAIGNLPPVTAGDQSNEDRMHRSMGLTDLNLQRIRQSIPGGTWRDWDQDLVSPCHRKPSGKSFAGVYARMKWEDPAPTITTQFINYGTGRFGHPEQDRALTLREGAIIQTFPKNYKFVPKDAPLYLTVVAKQIGNAVPPRLGQAIGKSIIKHLDILAEQPTKN
jgi:DNA (cytosine-5)-methyltransferase 1